MFPLAEGIDVRFLRFETPFLAEKFLYLLRISAGLPGLRVVLRKTPCFKAYLMGDEVAVLRVLCRVHVM